MILQLFFNFAQKIQFLKIFREQNFQKRDHTAAESLPWRKTTVLPPDGW
jgi:hypothetical protein